MKYPGSVKTVTLTSAGGVIVDGDGKVVITSRRSFKGVLQFGLPKGLIEPGEDPPTAALREAAEETGLEVELVRALPTIDYWYVQPERRGEPARRVRKFVHYFLMRSLGGDPSSHDAETEEVLFLDPVKAIDMVSYASERKVISAAVEMGSAEPT